MWDATCGHWRLGKGQRWYESLRNKYKPEQLVFLLLAESPPDPWDEEKRFFYSPVLSRYDNLYRGVAHVVLQREPRFDIREKEKNLWRLTELGFWLIDASDEPVIRKSPPERRAMIAAGLSHVLKIHNRNRPEAGMIVCHDLVYRRLATRLRDAGVVLLHDSSLPSPPGNYRNEFVEGFHKAVQEGYRRIGSGAHRMPPEMS